MEYGMLDSSLLDWYMTTFVPNPKRGYAQMNPPGANAKYSKKHETLTSELVHSAFRGDVRRLKIDGDWKRNIPISFAVVPETAESTTKLLAIDVDAGGMDAAARLFALASSYGLWSFFQVSISTKHDGGHFYVPLAHAIPSSQATDLTSRIQAAAGVLGEAYPHDDQELRLPLMLHLHAPNEPIRYPIILSTGETIAADDPFAAIDQLRTAWQANTDDAIMAAMMELPILAPTNRQKIHKSKVNPNSSASVIAWYNSHSDLESTLIGMNCDIKKNHCKCPWHKDSNPSFSLWEHKTTKQIVGRCRSEHSNCPAAALPYIDSFNAYCLIENMTATEAVIQIVADFPGEFGTRRETKIVPYVAPGATEPEAEPAPERTLAEKLVEHQALIDALRCDLRTALRAQAGRGGQVAVFDVTPGLGKTHAAADLANELHAAGKTVAIVAPTLKMAIDEWLPRLADGFVWRSRLAICTCYDRAYLASLSAKGYPLPKCLPSCAYRQQYFQRAGRTTIYQHNHLFLNDGKLLAGEDVVIIDESPLSALLEEHTAGHDEVRKLMNRIDSNDARDYARVPDPARPLVGALYTVGKAYARHAQPLHGAALRSALSEVLVDGDLARAIAAASTSKYAKPAPAPEQNDNGAQDAERLPVQFFPKLLAALTHDVSPTENNSLLRYARQADGSHGWIWYDKHHLIPDAIGRLDAPAILILDGSANEQICRTLYQPWPVEIVTIAAPVSPAVEIIQCSTTTSTRKLVQDDKKLDRTIRAIENVCVKLDILLDGGISYLAATDRLQEALGGDWLHFGGQRGRNDLAEARTMAIVASPTAPPDAIHHKAMALWADDAPIANEWVRGSAVADWRATDSRLDALNRLFGAEELRQAAHRCRPILATEHTTLLIFSPWNLTELGLAPTRTVSELVYSNSTANASTHEMYQARSIGNKKALYNMLYKSSSFAPPIVNPIFIANEPICSEMPPEQLPPPPSRERSDVRNSSVAVLGAFKPLFEGETIRVIRYQHKPNINLRLQENRHAN